MVKKKTAKNKKKGVVKRSNMKAKSKKKVIKKTTKKAVKRSKKVSVVPQGYNSVTPYLIIENAAAAITFYKKVFGAKEVLRMDHNGIVGHAELRMGDAKIMLADECPEMNAHSPHAYNGSPVSILLYIKNVDDVVDRAVSAGAQLVKPIQNMFYGDRSGVIKDPFGHIWCISTHIENVTPATMKKRAAALFGAK